MSPHGVESVLARRRDARDAAARTPLNQRVTTAGPAMDRGTEFAVSGGWRNFMKRSSLIRIALGALLAAALPVRAADNPLFELPTILSATFKRPTPANHLRPAPPPPTP